MRSFAGPVLAAKFFASLRKQQPINSACCVFNKTQARNLRAPAFFTLAYVVRYLCHVDLDG
jgi:hypothetical protein